MGVGKIPFLDLSNKTTGCLERLAEGKDLKSKGLWEQPLTPRKVVGHEDSLTRPCATNSPGPPSGGKSTDPLGHFTRIENSRKFQSRVHSAADKASFIG